MGPERGRRLEDAPKKVLLGAAAALLVLALLSGLDLSRWRDSPRRGVDAEYGALAPSGEAQTSGRSARGRRRLTAEDLLRLFGWKGGDPLAQEFAERFLADPELRKLWEDYKRHGDAAKLIRLLRESDRFKALLARFDGRKDFRALLEQLAKDPAWHETVLAFYPDERWPEPSASADGGLGFVTREAGAAPALTAGRVAAPAARVTGAARAAELGALLKALGARGPRAASGARGLAGLLDKGVVFAEACARAGLGEDCPRLAQGCAGGAACLPDDGSRGELRGGEPPGGEQDGEEAPPITPMAAIPEVGAGGAVGAQLGETMGEFDGQIDGGGTEGIGSSSPGVPPGGKKKKPKPACECTQWVDQGCAPKPRTGKRLFSRSCPNHCDKQNAFPDDASCGGPTVACSMPMQCRERKTGSGPCACVESICKDPCTGKTTKRTACPQCRPRPVE